MKFNESTVITEGKEHTVRYSESTTKKEHLKQQTMKQLEIVPLLLHKKRKRCGTI
eukprot:m.8743 g.8743  ORF g.8743 m.8743 type:complete len:55 (+) comp6194_c0_seq1:869-1033(+)